MLRGSVEEECPNRTLAVGSFGLNLIITNLLKTTPIDKVLFGSQ
jgi:hypothetical protein